MSASFEWVQKLYDRMSARKIGPANPALSADKKQEAYSLAGKIIDGAGIQFSPEDRLTFINALSRHQAGLEAAKDICAQIALVEEQLEKMAEFVGQDLSEMAKNGLRIKVFEYGWANAGKRAKNYIEKTMRDIEAQEARETRAVQEAQEVLVAIPVEAEAEILPPEILEILQQARADGVHITAAFRSTARAFPNGAADHPPHQKDTAVTVSESSRHQPAAEPEKPGPSPEQIYAQTLSRLLELQREAVEAEASAALRQGFAREIHASLGEAIEFHTLVHEEAREKLAAVAAQIADARAAQENLIAALEAQKIKPCARTAENLLVASALADDELPGLSVVIPEPVEAKMQTHDLVAYEGNTDVRICEIVSGIKAAREAARAQEQTALEQEAKNDALKKYHTACQFATKKIEKATETGERMIIQYGIDNARLQAQMPVVAPAEELALTQS